MEKASIMLAEPNKIGCTAFISQVERLHQGRMNIGVIGQRRFRIISLDTELPYLRGQVEHFPLTESEPESQEVLADRLRPWVVRYLDDLSRLSEVELKIDQLPTEPIALAYAAAALLQAPAEEKQQLLNSERASALLTDLRTIYRREIAIMKAVGEDLSQDQGPFSLN